MAERGKLSQKIASSTPRPKNCTYILIRVGPKNSPGQVLAENVLDASTLSGAIQAVPNIYY